ncbi:MAG: 3-phosphoshikimate 1-carboxyvinyltransferase [Spirochaetaceae bacterium]|nr:3-phosphoshikimate 1-carboxyvinyltransferase [Myxococcales bacterium]MCB9722555.1 3-phosphoshikimate 1-carboxyvinyltransferase [Spirochaetaceae bacterium]HPG25739.1 3-phosphoshikimate 1-carboxyvinyltransferase [Myxococcota bacterium]
MALRPVLPPKLAIKPRGPLDGRVSVPGSKSITNRVLLLAALAEGESRLRGGLESDDTVVMRAALRAMGIGLETAKDPEDTAGTGEIWTVRGRGGRFEPPDHALDCGNSGTTVRFLTAALTLASGPIVVDGNARMRERPISDLVTALRALGAGLTVEGRNDCPPVRVHGGGLPGGPATIDGSRSSQYVSAVLQAAPYADRDVELRFKEGVVVSRPYIDLTIEVMRDFGAEVEWRGAPADEHLFVRAGKTYAARDYTIEPDASSAAYPFCAAAIAGGRVTVAGIPERSQQADFKILGLLERMGCGVEREGDRVTVVGSARPLRSLGEIDMNDFPDAVLAYAVVALFADGPTTIRNVANLRIKETDRLAALETELRRLGARAEAGPDWLRIEPGPLRGAEIETYDDHRMAMSFALAGLRVPDVVILDPACVSKTWPGYFDALTAL